MVDAVERVPEVGGEIAQHGERRRGTVGNLLGDAVQDVEQEMGVELQAQLLELRAQRLGLGAHRVPVLGLLGELGIDPEIAEAPRGKRNRVVGPGQDEIVERVAAGVRPAQQLPGRRASSVAMNAAPPKDRRASQAADFRFSLLASGCDA